MIRAVPSLLAPIAMLALSPNLSRADSISFTGVGGVAATPVSYIGTMDVTSVGSGTSAVLSISLTNNSTGAAGTYGYITGFGFSMPTGTHVTGVTASSSNANFHFLQASNPADQISLQGGKFTYAFSTDPTQLHTVATNEIALGLHSGQTATFTVNLTGTGLNTLTAVGVLTALSQSPGIPFDVRFRSTNTAYYQGVYPPDGDKIPYSSYTVNKPPSSVPAPAGLILGAVGVVCMVGRMKLRRMAA